MSVVFADALYIAFLSLAPCHRHPTTADIKLLQNIDFLYLKILSSLIAHHSLFIKVLGK